MVIGRPCPRGLCAFRDGLAEQPDLCDRLRVLLRATVSGPPLGVFLMSADGGVDEKVEREVLRHALPSGRRRYRAPPPCEQMAEPATRALELSFYGRKLNLKAVRGCPEPKRSTRDLSVICVTAYAS